MKTGPELARRIRLAEGIQRRSESADDKSISPRYEVRKSERLTGKTNENRATPERGASNGMEKFDPFEGKWSREQSCGFLPLKLLQAKIVILTIAGRGGDFN